MSEDGEGTPDWIRCDNCGIQLVTISERIKHLEGAKDRVRVRLAEMTKESQGLSIYQEKLLFDAIEGEVPK